MHGNGFGESCHQRKLRQSGPRTLPAQYWVTFHYVWRNSTVERKANRCCQFTCFSWMHPCSCYYLQLTSNIGTTSTDVRSMMTASLGIYPHRINTTNKGNDVYLFVWFTFTKVILLCMSFLFHCNLFLYKADVNRCKQGQINIVFMWNTTLFSGYEVANILIYNLTSITLYCYPSYQYLVALMAC